LSDAVPLPPEMIAPACPEETRNRQRKMNKQYQKKQNKTLFFKKIVSIHTHTTAGWGGLSSDERNDWLLNWAVLQKFSGFFFCRSSNLSNQDDT